MITKAIILAGGRGSRLSPITKSTNKQLLPVFDKPLFFYPLSVLMLANIRKILIIVNKGQIKNFYNSVGNGKHLGINIIYKEQENPTGIPEAFKIGKDFISNDNIALILGDNFFYGQSFANIISQNSFSSGCKIFLKDVSNPENYGVAQIKKDKIIKIKEKPKKMISNKAITGLYYFDKNVCKYVKTLKPSKRGETEIVDLINIYHKLNLLSYTQIGRGAIWSDLGKIEELTNISNFVYSIEKIQNIKIGCLDEIAYAKKWISNTQLKKNILFYGNCSYSKYLKKLI